MYIFSAEAINKYNASASSTQKPAPGDRSFKLAYAVGALTGVISIDNITVRLNPKRTSCASLVTNNLNHSFWFHSKYGGLTINDQRFAEAEYEPSDSYNYPFDGTFGFGFAQISNSDQSSTPIDNLFDQGQIKKKIFCIHFNKKDVTPGGELIIGGCDIQAEQWLECTQPNVTWQTTVSSVDVVPKSPNETQKITVCEKGCNVLFDTGSSIIGGQNETLDAIANKIGAPFNETYNEYLIACDAKDLPTIEFNFGTFKTILTSDDYVTPYWVGAWITLIVWLIDCGKNKFRWFSCSFFRGIYADWAWWDCQKPHSTDYFSVSHSSENLPLFSTRRIYVLDWQKGNKLQEISR